MIPTPASLPEMRCEQTSAVNPPRKNAMTSKIFFKYEMHWKNHGAVSLMRRTGIAIDKMTVVVAIVDPARMSSAAIKQISS